MHVLVLVLFFVAFDFYYGVSMIQKKVDVASGRPLRTVKPLESASDRAQSAS